MTFENLIDLIKPFMNIRRSQIKTLLALVVGLIRGGTIGVAAIGRSMEGPALEKHRIKRVDRYLGNNNFDRVGAARDLIQKLCESYKRVFVSIDWTDGEDGVHTILEASLVTRSRAIPIWVKVAVKCDLQGRQNFLEEEFLEELTNLFPRNKEVVILADRGFHRVSFLKKLKQLGFRFIVRLPMNTWMDSPSFHGVLGDLVVKRGFFRDFGWIFLHKRERLKVRVVVCFDYEQEETWLLATNLDLRFKAVIEAYGRRFEIEETNKDIKNERNGLKLRGLKLSSPERLERLLLVVSLAYVVMVLAGVYGERKRIHRRLMANTERNRTLALWRKSGK